MKLPISDMKVHMISQSQNGVCLRSRPYVVVWRAPLPVALSGVGTCESSSAPFSEFASLLGLLTQNSLFEGWCGMLPLTSDNAWSVYGVPLSVAVQVTAA